MGAFALAAAQARVETRVSPALSSTWLWVVPFPRKAPEAAVPLGHTGVDCCWVLPEADRVAGLQQAAGPAWEAGEAPPDSSAAFSGICLFQTALTTSLRFCNLGSSPLRSFLGL